ncbi:Lysozyme M1 precursor [uncultured Clostridium sp.]|jgi:lysozyme|nr:Lysozyme M1 precursor [uncultured Clostridium sp.]
MQRTAGTEVTAMLKQGIDISAWQGNIDWDQVKNCIEAIIIRAGYGKNNIDQKWVPNVEAVRDSSLDVGAYWFSYAYTADMAYMEGCYAANAVKNKFGDRQIPIAFDLEYDSVAYAAKKGVKIGRAEATLFAIRFLTAVKEFGYRPMLYTNIDYIRNYFDLGVIRAAIPDLLLWVACWGSEPKDYNMAVWQYSSKGSVAGIIGNVDMDEVYVDMEIRDGVAVPAPAPVQENGRKQMRVTAKTWLNIREKPDVNSEDLGDLPAGTVITVDKIENGWAHFEGYCSAQWLKQ